MLGMLGRLFGRGRHERAGFELYNVAVRAARDPRLYAALGVPDTLDGRFDMVGAHAFLLIHRLHGMPPPGPALAQAVFDAMFSDMDQTLREIGSSDMSLAKRMKAMWEAFNGRASAYAEAIEHADKEALATALARNVWRGREPDADARALAGIMLRQHQHLAAQPLERLLAGQVSFLPSEPVSP